MAIHFTIDEFADRQQRTIEQLKSRNLDGLLMFRQESMYYLSGYDSFGYVFFQCLYLDLDGNLMLLTRAPDLRQARHTSILEDIRIWQDSAEADPAVAVAQHRAGPRLRIGDDDLAARLVAETDGEYPDAPLGRRLCRLQRKRVVILAIGDQQIVVDTFVVVALQRLFC